MSKEILRRRCNKQAAAAGSHDCNVLDYNICISTVVLNGGARTPSYTDSRVPSDEADNTQTERSERQ